MAKYCNPAVEDAALNEIKNNANLMIVCTTMPTTRAEAVTTYALADVAVAPADFTLAPGDTSGRKATVAAKTGVPIDASGDGLFVALVDATRLLYVTTCTLKTLAQNDQVNIPAWDIEFNNPA